MLSMQPSSSALRCQRQSSSSRHGLPLISTATPCLAQLENGLDVNVVAGPAQQLPARDVTQDCRVGVRDGGDDALGLLVAA